MYRRLTLCVPTTTAAGLASHLSPHFGTAPYYTLVELGSGRIDVVANRSVQPADGHCEGAEALECAAFDAVVCRGANGPATEGVRAHGIPVLRTDAGSVAEAVRAFRQGKLSLLAQPRAWNRGHGLMRRAGTW